MGVQQSREIGKCKGPEVGDYPAYLSPVKRVAEEEGKRQRGSRK